MITSASEEFSFPIMMSNPLANFSISSASNNSSRWRINSSRVFHHQEDHQVIEEEEDDDDDDGHTEVRSMCEGCFATTYRRKRERLSFQSMEELEMEERMDYLWEDFNEEEVEKNEELREVQRSREVCVLQGTKMGSGMSIMGKLLKLKGLFSFRRKPAQSKIMRQRW